MKIIQLRQDIIISGMEHFDPAQIFDCGQCFRFNKEDGGAYSGIAKNRILKLARVAEGVRIENMTPETFETEWKNYFALDLDYAAIRRAIAADACIADALTYGDGIRLLRQEPWETMVSFIISQNNNIPRIKAIIQTLCRRYGEEIESGCFLFPRPERLAAATAEALREAGAGYRDAYILDAARKVCSGEIDLDLLERSETQDARETLMRINGIGGKVADCILLFALGRYEVCPHDVWVKRIFKQRYGLSCVTEKTGYALARQKWGNYAGIAQQYLFFHERALAKGAADENGRDHSGIQSAAQRT
jgi:N-glycosylase/DNA lyase